MSRLPDLDAWAIFARVADLGSFARAAADLSLSNPTVSKAITRLEQRLHVALFHRTSRQITLTESGQAVLERARRILAEGEAAEAELSAQAEAPSGLVRMTAPMSFGTKQLAPLLPGFLATYPGVTLDLHLSDAREDLIAGGYDLAVRIAALEDSSLRARRLSAIRRPIVAAPAYLERNGSPSHPRDLERFDGVCYANVASRDVWHLHHVTLGKWDVRVRARVITNNADVIVPALVAGQGVAIQPEFSIKRELEEGKLVEILPGWSLEPISLYIVTPPSSLRPARARVLIDYLVEKLAEGD
ncbi:transcriptional regulator, LysR family [Novosphingobium sp. CF614]|uniref:LysR family transcriptional regulator n=1 Tax=Novosphingobium sp. CF614 TaxID=1884364 RepID=UPI0008E5F422|nr:LysR family transcriptional regulator [Novosphingobium sp. CF614]SFG49669.1 transcriptional regulator, LysR family [Novosphingobium sp. CF614]